MTGIITEANVEEVILGWLEGLGENIIIRPTLFSGELRVASWNIKKELTEL